MVRYIRNQSGRIGSGRVGNGEGIGVIPRGRGITGRGGNDLTWCKGVWNGIEMFDEGHMKGIEHSVPSRIP